MDPIRELFDRWRQATTNARYDAWCQAQDDDIIVSNL